MNFALALVVGLLFGLGCYGVLSGYRVRVVLGLTLWGHAVNLFLIAVSGGPISGDPVPQALILTAIVIGLGMQAVLMALFRARARIKGESS